MARAVVALCLGLGLAGCTVPPLADDLEVADAYAAEPVSTDVAAVYLTIRNSGSLPDTLDGASTPIARMAHLHRMSAPTAAMRATASPEIPAGGSLELRPGGLHLMLMDLTARPRVGDSVEVTLLLRRHRPLTVRVPVVSYLEVGERAAVGADEDRR